MQNNTASETKDNSLTVPNTNNNSPPSNGEDPICNYIIPDITDFEVKIQLLFIYLMFKYSSMFHYKSNLNKIYRCM